MLYYVNFQKTHLYVIMKSFKLHGSVKVKHALQAKLFV